MELLAHIIAFLVGFFGTAALIVLAMWWFDIDF